MINENLEERSSEGNLIEIIIEEFKKLPKGMKITTATGLAGLGIMRYGVVKDQRDLIMLGGAAIIGAVVAELYYLTKARDGYLWRWKLKY